MEAYAHIDEARIIYRMPNLHVSQYSMSKPQLRALRVSYPVFAPRDAPCYGSRFRVGFPRECLRALLVTVGGVGEACLSHLHAGRIVDFLMWSSRAAMRRRSRSSTATGHRTPFALAPPLAAPCFPRLGGVYLGRRLSWCRHSRDVRRDPHNLGTAEACTSRARLSM